MVDIVRYSLIHLYEGGLPVKKETTKDRVCIILKECPETRDSYWDLLIEFYRRHFGTTDLKKLKRLKAPEVDSVRRARQYLQERHPELRGKTWEERQAFAGQVRKAFGADHYGLEGGSPSVNLS